MSDVRRYVWGDPEGNDYFIAATQREAFELSCKHIGVDPGADDETIEDAGGWPEAQWTQEPDDRVFPVANYDEENGPTITKTCAEWAATEPVGYFAGTNY